MLGSVSKALRMTPGKTPEEIGGVSHSLLSADLMKMLLLPPSVTKPCSFTKSASTPTTVTIVVTAPLQGTAWEATLSCMSLDPTQTPTPTNTPTETTTQTPTPTKVIGNSILFTQANNDYLSVTGSTAWAVGTGDFTVEGWYYQTNNGNTNFLFSLGNAQLFAMAIGSGGNKLSGYMGGARISNQNISTATNVWYHWAVTRSSGTYNTYFNGTRTDTLANSTNVTDSVSTFYRNETGCYLDFLKREESDLGSRPQHLWNKVIKIAELLKEGEQFPVTHWAEIYPEISFI